LFCVIYFRLEVQYRRRLQWLARLQILHSSSLHMILMALGLYAVLAGFLLPG